MKKLLTIAIAGLLAGSVFASEEQLTVDRCWTPLQINLASPIGLPWADRDVYGLRLNLIYGHSLDVAGLDLGFVGANRGTFRGVQVNAFNLVEGSFRGVQISPLANVVAIKKGCGVQLGGLLNWYLDDGAGVQFGLLNFSGAFTGVQFGFVNWDSRISTGLMLGAVNISDSDFEGCEFGLLNTCYGNLRGSQIGLFNFSFARSEGLQLGLFNAAEDHTGIQIGLLNLNANGRLPVMALVNANFR